MLKSVINTQFIFWFCFQTVLQKRNSIYEICELFFNRWQVHHEKLLSEKLKIKHNIYFLMPKKTKFFIFEKWNDSI